MKRAFLFLVVLMVGYYGYQAFEVYNRCRPLVCVTEGKMTEIAADVKAVVLDAGEDTTIVSPQKVRCYGDLVYFVSERVLYCFRQNGTFVGQITRPEELLVADYLIDTGGEQLIVFGNQDEVWYYTVGGELKERIRLPQDEEYSRLRSVAYYRNRVWVVKERQTSPGSRLEQVVTEYDITLVPLNNYPLHPTDAAYRPEVYTCLEPQFAVAPDNQEMYVYEASRFPESLLPDTLAIGRYRSIYPQRGNSGTMTIYPVRLGERFCFASGTGRTDPYLFCYDKVKNKCWELQHGIKDNIYHTGQVDNLFPLDLTGDGYWYTKSKGDIAARFPEAARKDIPVLFLVEMKKA